MNPVPLFPIIVTLPLLLGSVCNAELRTWTAVNGKEVKAEFVSNEKGIVKLKLKSGKVFEVPAKKLSKKDNEFISSLAKPDGVNSEELEYSGLRLIGSADDDELDRNNLLDVVGIYPLHQETKLFQDHT